MRFHAAIIALADLRAAAASKPAAYFAEVVLSGHVDGDRIIIPWDAYYALLRRWSGPGQELSYSQAVEAVAYAREGDDSWLAGRHLSMLRSWRRNRMGACPSCRLFKLQNRLVDLVRASPALRPRF